MPTNRAASKQPARPFLGRVAPDEFIGRQAELSRLVAHAETGGGALLLLAAPAAGVTELLLQSYDELFARHGETVPVYFSRAAGDAAPGPAALRFMNEFLRQLVAFQRRDPQLARAALTHAEALELARFKDQEWLSQLLEGVAAAQRKGDEAELAGLCLSAPQRARQHGTEVCLLLDDAEAADSPGLLREVLLRGGRAVVAGYRRQLLALAQRAQGTLDGAQTLRLDYLNETDAGRLLADMAQRAEVAINDETRDLLVLQTGGSPVFLRALAQAAQGPLDSFLNAQNVYVRELMGGSLHRYFSRAWDDAGLAPETRGRLLRLLHEHAARGERRAALGFWRKRLALDDDAFGRLMQTLHAREWAAVGATSVEVRPGLPVRDDYLAAQFRLEVEAAPRAQVLADALAETLKRAPALMQRAYRRGAALPWREVLANFKGRSVPFSLLDAHHYALQYEDLEPEEIPAALAQEETRLALPQIVNVATCASYQPAMQHLSDEEACLVAHGFEAGRYTDEDETVWVCAQLEAKNPARLSLVKIWREGLAKFAAKLNLSPARVWLVCPSGFAPEARAYLTENGCYSSSGAQFERLRALLSTSAERETAVADYELVIPMGDETELVSAATLEEIARRAELPAQTVNQIKTALVEACINATEHSHSPDRKIHQRFTLTPDSLIVTVASRGVTQPLFNPASLNGIPDKRGWGLKLIRSLMDEVEFERVDDGTRLRMTKYLKKCN
jgi:serine/threonine-protein kinase RsbW